MNSQTLPLRNSEQATDRLVLLILLIYPDEPDYDPDDIRIVLVRDYEKTKDGDEPYWKFFGGSVEYLKTLGRWETGPEAVVREGVQETGITVPIESIEPLGKTTEPSRWRPGDFYTIEIYGASMKASQVVEQLQKQGIDLITKGGTYFYESDILEVGMPKVHLVQSADFRFLEKHREWLKTVSGFVTNLLFKALH